VDAWRVSDSILTDVLNGISTARVIFADISSIGANDGRAIRNGNVMYEVGLAHAARQPEEVVLFRSDNDPLLFDLSNVRVNKYDPDNNPEAAREQICAAIIEAVKETDLRKSIAVKQVAAALDFTCWSILIETKDDFIVHPVVRSMRDAASQAPVLSAISRLLELNVIQAEWVDITPETWAQISSGPPERAVNYKLTEFGVAVRTIAREKLRGTLDAAVAGDGERT
jgi:hypothetical protein